MKILRLTLLLLCLAGVAQAEPNFVFPSDVPLYLTDNLLNLLQNNPAQAQLDLAGPTVVQGPVSSIDLVPYQSMGIFYHDQYYNSFFKLENDEPISGEFPRIRLGDFDAYLLYAPNIDLATILPGYEVQVLCHPIAFENGQAYADCRLVGYSTPEDTEMLTWLDMNTYIYLMVWNEEHQDGREREQQINRAAEQSAQQAYELF